MTTTVHISLPPSTRRSHRWRLPLALVALLVAIALFAPLIAPYSLDLPKGYDAILNVPPSATHPFGTDNFGRDVMTRVIYGARVSLAVAFSAALLALALGTAYGSIAGMIGGATDRWLMRALDIALSIPRLLLLLAITAFWSAKLPLAAFIIVLGATGWFDVARLVRGEVQTLVRRDFVLAAESGGVRRLRILWRHLLPHLVPVLVVSTTLNVASTITLEAGLSFLGLGVQPPTPSWGNILLSGSGFVGAQWWLTLFPALATVLAVVSCHALGDALRDDFAMDQVPA